MSNDFRVFLALIIILVIYLLSAILRSIHSKFNIINKKLDTLLESTNASYPAKRDISPKAISAAQGGDRNKATDLIMQETLCSKLQAEALIVQIEQIAVKQRSGS